MFILVTAQSTGDEQRANLTCSSYQVELVPAGLLGISEPGKVVQICMCRKFLPFPTLLLLPTQCVCVCVCVCVSMNVSHRDTAIFLGNYRLMSQYV